MDECRYFGTEKPAALSLNRPLAYLEYSDCLPGKGTEQNNYPKVFFVWLNVQRNTNLQAPSDQFLRDVLSKFHFCVSFGPSFVMARRRL